MAIKTCTPTSPGSRCQTFDTFEEISTERPVRGSGGTVAQNRGSKHLRPDYQPASRGGHKRLYRLIDFKRDKLDIPAKVARIEYDPNRSTRIALFTMPTGKNDIFWPPKTQGRRSGDQQPPGGH